MYDEKEFRKMKEDEEGIMETIKKGIIDKGYNIEDDVKTDNSAHVTFSGKGESYVLNLLRLE
jgi:hypothetical protein